MTASDADGESSIFSACLETTGSRLMIEETTQCVLD